MSEFKIGEVIYEELNEKIMLELEYLDEKDEYDDDDFKDFILWNGNDTMSLSLLSEGERYYIDGVVKEWDEIIEYLDDNDMLDDIEPKHMTKRKITELFLYLLCREVVNNVIEDLNDEDKKEEEKRVNKYNDFKEEVDEYKYSTGFILGDTLKDMNMGEYFNKYKIADEVDYEIRFYKAKEESKDLPIGFSECYFKIEDLSNKIHYTMYNTSSAFAMELGNISYDEEDE